MYCNFTSLVGVKLKVSFSTLQDHRISCLTLLTLTIFKLVQCKCIGKLYIEYNFVPRYKSETLSFSQQGSLCTEPLGYTFKYFYNNIHQKVKCALQAKIQHLRRVLAFNKVYLKLLKKRRFCSCKKNHDSVYVLW